MSAENVTSAAMHDKQKISSTKITPPKSLDFNLCMHEYDNRNDYTSLF